MMDSTSGLVTRLAGPRPHLPANPEAIDALNSIRTTPYECSFLSRISGETHGETAGLLAVDWETVSPWMKLMGDIRAHYHIAQCVGSEWV
jgi:hypothetical protein